MTLQARNPRQSQDSSRRLGKWLILHGHTSLLDRSQDFDITLFQYEVPQGQHIFLGCVACLSYITQVHPHNYSSSHDRVYCPRCTAAMGRSRHNSYFDNVAMGQNLSLPYWVGSVVFNLPFGYQGFDPQPYVDCNYYPACLRRIGSSSRRLCLVVTR